MLQSLFPLFLFATTIFAQSVFIGLPTFDQVVKAGSDLVVQVQQQDSLTSVVNVVVIVGLQSCPNSACVLPTEELGTVLYNGPFNPQFHGPPPPYQNFTVRVPSTIPPGNASIGVVYLGLVGDAVYPLYETLNQSIVIA